MHTRIGKHIDFHGKHIAQAKVSKHMSNTLKGEMQWGKNNEYVYKYIQNNG